MVSGSDAIDHRVCPWRLGPAGLPQQPLVFRPHLLTLSDAVCRYPSYPSYGPIAGSRLNSQSMPAAQPVEGGNDLVPLPALLCDRFEWVFQVSYAGFSSTPTRVFSNFSVRPRRNRHTGRQDCLGKWAQRPGEFQDLGVPHGAGRIARTVLSPTGVGLGFESSSLHCPAPDAPVACEMSNIVVRRMLCCGCLWQWWLHRGAFCAIYGSLSEGAKTIHDSGADAFPF